MTSPFPEAVSIVGPLKKKILPILGFSFVLIPSFLMDQPIRSWIRELQVPIIRHWAGILTWIGVGAVLFSIALVLYGIGRWRGLPRLRTAGARGLAALAVSGVAVQIVKHLVGRPRPRLADQGVGAWGPSIASGHDSFPSGHTIASFALAAVLPSVYPSARWLWYSTAFLVGLTRLYLDAHFTTDVLAGSLLGVLIGAWVMTLSMGHKKS